MSNRTSRKNEQIDVVHELFARISGLAAMLNGAATNHFQGIDSQIRDQYIQEYINNVAETATMLYAFGDCITTLWTNNDEINEIAVAAWEQGTEFHREYVKYLADREANKNSILEYIGKIQSIKPDFQTREVDTSSASACYIATAVYGSCDCPEVWTLRRFRDFTLAATWYGRAFITTYYTLSPTLVRWFGKSNWFKQIAIIPLNRLIKHLHKKGIQSSPYKDHIY